MTLPRVLLVDDTPEVLKFCKDLLSADFEIVGTAADGKSALTAFAMTNPDVLVLDVSMPYLNGIEVAQRIRSSNSRVAIVFLSSEGHLVAAAMEAGGSGFVIKDRIRTDLKIAIREALAGRVFVSSADRGL